MLTGTVTYLKHDKGAIGDGATLHGCKVAYVVADCKANKEKDEKEDTTDTAKENKDKSQFLSSAARLSISRQETVTVASQLPNAYQDDSLQVRE